MKLMTILASSALILVACSRVGPASNMDDAESKLRAADAALQEAIEKKDAEAVAAFYASDASLLPTAEPIVVGREAIREEWAHIMAIPGFSNSGTLSEAVVAASGDLGYTTGSYNSAMIVEDGSSTVEPGKWVTVWRKSPEGAWEIAVDIYNTDIPPPDHK